MKEMEMLLKTVSDGLKILAQGVKVIADKLETFAEENEGKPVRSPGRKVPVREARVKPSASKAPRKTAVRPGPKGKKAEPMADRVYEVMRRMGGPADLDLLAAKLGFNKKQVHNAIFKLKKEGRIEGVSKGVYRVKP